MDGGTERQSNGGKEEGKDGGTERQRDGGRQGDERVSGWMVTETL